MTKHPHKLILLQNKIWRCGLEGCTFHVYRGLEYILMGRDAVCWQCGELFKVGLDTLKQEMPKCEECTLNISKIAEITEHKAVQRKLGPDDKPETWEELVEQYGTKSKTMAEDIMKKPEENEDKPESIDLPTKDTDNE